MCGQVGVHGAVLWVVGVCVCKVHAFVGAHLGLHIGYVYVPWVGMSVGGVVCSHLAGSGVWVGSWGFLEHPVFRLCVYSGLLKVGVDEV